LTHIGVWIEIGNGIYESIGGGQCNELGDIADFVTKVLAVLLLEVKVEELVSIVVS
jgi:hypothetical protein